jgi:hypothetical protein
MAAPDPSNRDGLPPRYHLGMTLADRKRRNRHQVTGDPDTRGMRPVVPADQLFCIPTIYDASNN